VCVYLLIQLMLLQYVKIFFLKFILLNNCLTGYIIIFAHDKKK